MANLPKDLGFTRDLFIMPFDHRHSRSTYSHTASQVNLELQPFPILVTRNLSEKRRIQWPTYPKTWASPETSSSCRLITAIAGQHTRILRHRSIWNCSHFRFLLPVISAKKGESNGQLTQRPGLH